MDEEIAATVAGCTAAHRRLEATVASVDDATARRPSLLPGWTVGHVLTHVARNAESHVRMLEAALAGQAVEQYPGDWPEDYVARELPLALADLPDRLTVDGRADLLAWLVGRAGQPAALDLASWQAKWRYYHRPPEGS